MDIISRASWGARAPKSRVTGDTIRETYLHHSAGPHSGAAGVRAIQNYHMDRQGWVDIAYNFLIDPDTLTVFEGRGWGVRPGSQKNHNAGTWSVCALGNFQTETPSPQLLVTIALLIQHGHSLGKIPKVLTGGHRDAPNQSTACPGTNLHRQIPTIRLLLEEENMAKIPVEWWATAAFTWAIGNGLYTEKKNLNEVREEYDFQQLVTLHHRYHIKFGGAGGAHDHDGRYVKNITVSK